MKEEKQLSYLKPDRSNFTPNFQRIDDDDIIDIGWAEGELSDGRPYRLECWNEDGLSSITYYFSIEGMESATKESLADLLVSEGLIEFADPSSRYVTMVILPDASNNKMFTVSVLIGDETTIYADDKRPINPYPGSPW